jgi:site-specific DNA-methyltransferase (adenine-specific)
MRQETIIQNQKIICNDCLEEMKSMSEDCIDVVVFSPPYNVGHNYNTYDDNLSLEDYIVWMSNIFIEVKRLLKPNGSFFLNIGGTCKEPWRAMQLAMCAGKFFVLQNDIVWVKSITVADNSYGHFKPINSSRFLNQQHESIFHFTKTGDVVLDRLSIGVPYQDESNIERWAHKSKGEKSNKRCRGNVWHIPYKTVKSKKKHTAGFPIELPENCIRLHGLRPDLVVLDPFLGAGSTLQACKKLNLSGIGIELDPYYCCLAEDNLNGE